MSEKELEEYLKVVEPNFDSHLEKGTIEMSNEYYNLLEEKMARLINENQSLKKQLEKKYSKIGTLMNEVLYEENTKLINQQKKFIKYLESEIGCREFISDLLFNHNKELKVYKEVLQKYKEIIGDERNERRN